jgi:hypothetical protein
MAFNSVAERRNGGDDRDSSVSLGAAVRSIFLTLAVLLASISAVHAADDPATDAARASLERIRALRAQRPGDGLIEGMLYDTLSTGIARVDPSSGYVERLPHPDSVVTGGFDGLTTSLTAASGVRRRSSRR